MARSLRITSLLFIFATLVALNVQRASAQLVVTTDEDEDFVKYIDVGTLAVTDLFRPLDSVVGGAGSDAPEGIAADDANRVFYWQDDAELYVTLYDNLDINGFMVTTKVSPNIRCTTCTADTSMEGLTFANGTLYAVRNTASATAGPEGLYSVNVTNGVATLLRNWDDDPGVPAAADIDIRDIAYNPADGLFYVYNNDNDTASSGFSGQKAGIYSVDVNNVLGGGAYAVALVVATSDVVTLCNCTAHPPATSTCCGSLTAPDIEGMAIGNGKIYLTIDQLGPILVWDIVAAAWDPNLANPWTTTELNAGGTWAPSALLPAPIANIGVAVTSVSSIDRPVSNNGLIGVGEQATYVITVTNTGPENATTMNYSVVFSGTAAFTVSNAVGQSSSPSIGGSTVSGSLSPFNLAQSEQLTITLNVTGAGTLSVAATVAVVGNPPDTIPGNNTAGHSAEVSVLPDIDLTFTTEQSSPASDVPGTGLKFHFDTAVTTQKFRKPFRSADGEYIALWADTDDADTDIDEIYIRRDPVGDWAVAAREGVTTIGDCETIDSMILNPDVPINDNGQYAFANDTNAASADETVVLFDGTNHVAVARETRFIPALGVPYAGTTDSPAIDGLGRVAFRVASLAAPAVPATQNSVLLADNGTRILAQKGITVPAGQVASETWLSWDADTLNIDCLGVNWLVVGDLNGATTSNDVFAVNGRVVLQEGSGVTGVTGNLPAFSTTAGVITATMLGNGNWYAHGTTATTNQDWAIEGNGNSYSLLGKHSDPIFTGSTELWSDVDGFSPTFFGVAMNRQGDYVLIGRTNIANISRNAVAVFNGTTELFREGDPIDLDLDGLYNDDAFVSNFDVNIEDWCVLTDDGVFYVVINLRNNAGTFIGKALLEIDVAESPLPSSADLYVSNTISDNSLEAVGQHTTFTINVCNHGPLDATNVTMTDSLPAGLEFVSATGGAAETAPGTNIVAASLATLASCDCREFTITVEGSAEGVLNNTALAAATQSDPNNLDNSASAAVTVDNRADVEVSITDNGGSGIGGNFVYTITITNHGPATANNVTMTDTLDPVTTFVSATNGAVQGPVGVVTRTFATIPPNTSQVVQVTVTGTAQALATNSVTISADEPDDNASNNTDSLDTPVDDSAEVAINLTDNGRHNINTNYDLVLTVSNDGPITATNVDVTATLPAGLSFVSATNGAVENPGGSGNVEATLASIPSQGSQVILITVTTAIRGAYNVTVSATANETDNDPLNNSATITTITGSYRQILPIATHIDGHPTAVVNGLLDADNNPIYGEFGQFGVQTSGILNFNVSEDGSRWTLEGLADIADTTINGVMMLGSGFNGSLFAQEGKPAVDTTSCVTYTFFDDDVGFNSNNDFSWGAITSSPDVTYTNIGGVDVNIAQSGDNVFGLQGGAGTINNSMVSEHLLDDGSVGFNASNISGSRAALVYWDSVTGINVFMERNVTTIGGDVITALPVERIFYTTPNGLHTLVRAGIAAGSIVAYDGSSVIRTGDIFGAVTIDSVFDIAMANNGDWIARGDQPGDNDWVIRNGALVAATGLSINGGAETWGNTIGNIAINSMGDYVIGGNTSETDVNIDNVIVLNGTDIVVRESDPIDLDSDGLFDDDAFINTVNAFQVRLSNDGRLHFLATLKNAEGTSLRPAFLVVDVSQGCPTIQGDAGGNGSRNGIDVADFVDCILTGGVPAGACNCVDYDNDDDVDFADLSAFATQLVTDPA